MLNEKAIIIHLMAELIKKTQYCYYNYYNHNIKRLNIKSHVHCGVYIKINLDLFNYATKTDCKNPTGVDTSKLAAKSDLPILNAINREKKI